MKVPNYKSSAYSMELLGLGGEKFLEIENIQQSSFHVNTKNLANGIFLAVLKNEKGVVETEKIFIQNN